MSVLSTVLGDSNEVVFDEIGNRILNLLENSNKHMFITGNAGTGKSTLIAQFRNTTSKKTILLSPTGIGAMNIGGQTIHSFFDFPLSYIDPDAIHKSKKLQAIYKDIDTIIIDEVSMVRADMLDGIDKALRINRGNKEPFGGVQMIFVGDLYQLPPVVSDEESKKYIAKQYQSEFFFDSHIINDLTTGVGFLGFSDSFEVIQLKKIHRQVDIEFIEILNAIRNGTVNHEQIELLNSRVIADDEDHTGTILLSTNNYKVNNINEYNLAKIDSIERKYLSTQAGNFGPYYPTNQELRLKVGAQIMMLKNDSLRGYVNGSIGYVVSMSEDQIEVSINNKTIVVDRSDWRKIRYEYSFTNERLEEFETGNFHQFPIKLAWAITIHKSQGQSFQKLILDLDRGAFAHGQLYVALSRARSFNGLHLVRPIKQSDIIVNKKISAWLEHYA